MRIEETEENSEEDCCIVELIAEYNDFLHLN